MEDEDVKSPDIVAHSQELIVPTFDEDGTRSGTTIFPFGVQEFARHLNALSVQIVNSEVFVYQEARGWVDLAELSVKSPRGNISSIPTSPRKPTE